MGKDKETLLVVAIQVSYLSLCQSLCGKPKQRYRGPMIHTTLLTGFYPAINGQRMRGYTAKPTSCSNKYQSEMDSGINGFDFHR
jgi:hypothetical protein